MRALNLVLTTVFAIGAIAFWIEWLLFPISPFTFNTAALQPIAITLSAAAGVGWLLLSRSRPHDRETRCRKCGYILRGLAEPRCSECGERI